MLLPPQTLLVLESPAPPQLGAAQLSANDPFILPATTAATALATSAHGVPPGHPHDAVSDGLATAGELLVSGLPAEAALAVTALPQPPASSGSRGPLGGLLPTEHGNVHGGISDAHSLLEALPMGSLSIGLGVVLITIAAAGFWLWRACCSVRAGARTAPGDRTGRRRGKHVALAAEDPDEHYEPSTIATQETRLVLSERRLALRA